MEEKKGKREGKQTKEKEKGGPEVKHLFPVLATQRADHASTHIQEKILTAMINGFQISNPLFHNILCGEVWIPSR